MLRLQRMEKDKPGKLMRRNYDKGDRASLVRTINLLFNKNSALKNKINALKRQLERRKMELSNYSDDVHEIYSQEKIKECIDSESERATILAVSMMMFNDRYGKKGNVLKGKGANGKNQY